jgi:hypothetical protein
METTSLTWPAASTNPANAESAPGKDAAQTKILALRTAGHSIDEIAEALAAEAPR